MKKLVLFLSSCILLSVVSCKRNSEEGYGKIITNNISVAGFSSIEIGAPLDAEIIVDSTKSASLSIKGYANLLEKITSKVEGGKLIIEKEGLIDFYTDKDIVATIIVPSLSAFTINGASDADIKGNLTGNSFRLKVSGAGDVTIDNLHVNNFESTLSGAGDLTIKNGIVENASFHVRGAGDVSAFALQAKTVNANVTGAGDIDVSVSEKLNARVAGAGSISYKGHPQVQSDISGIGEVDDAN